MTIDIDKGPSSILRFMLWLTTALGFAATVLFAGFLLGTGASNRPEVNAAAASFFQTASPPIWIILFLNVASFIGAVVAAYAAIKITPRTSLRVADLQATVTREAIAVAASSAEAAAQSAKAANRSSDNQGIHAVARLRQEWINELRARIAEALALLSNWRKAGASATEDQRLRLDDRVIKANEVMAKIELLLNPAEAPSRKLMRALRALEAAAGDYDKRQALVAPVTAAAQVVLKEEWDRVRDELHGKLPRQSANREGGGE
ncbi:hypothetical protein [Sphingomonas adhaesiva]|uniref:hypothetical protein n=1 Tax=Sphingomonas adhaesiva TaxID=28212 RepID=UPI002FF9E9FF